jgi:hypothetical protein
MGMIIVPTNYADEDHCADLAVSPAAVATYPVTRLQSKLRSDTWRSSSLAQQVITGSFGGNARRITTFSLWPGRGQASLIGSQVRWEFFQEPGLVTSVYDQTFDFFTPTGENWNEFLWGIHPWGVEEGDYTARLAPLIKFVSALYVSSFRVTITNLGNVDTDYFEASRLWLGDYVEAPYNAAVGAVPSWVGASQAERMVGGSLDRLERLGQARELQFAIMLSSESDRQRWSDLMYLCDPAREVIVSLFPRQGSRRERDHTVMGSLKSPNRDLVFESGSPLHKLQLSIAES